MGWRPYSAVLDYSEPSLRRARGGRHDQTRRRRHDGRPDAQTHVAPSDKGVRTGCLMMLLRRKREGGRRWRWMGPNAAGRRSDDRLAMLFWFGVLYLTGTMVFLAGPAEHRRSDRT